MADDIDSYRPIGELVGNIDPRVWASPGPVSDAYVASEAIIRALFGPVGGGKTSTCLIAEVFEAIRSPRCTDGVRRYRLLAIRDTYRELYKTLIPTWHKLFKPPDGDWQGGQDRPAKHRLKFLDDYGPADFEVEFAAIPAGSIRAWLDGYEPSAIFMNAASGHPEEVLDYGLTRVGRYPQQSLLPRGHHIRRHVALDSNKADVTHWIYQLQERARLREMDEILGVPLIEVFDQPGGRDPGAENIPNLPPGYYKTQIQTLAKKPWLLRIMVDNKWGPDRSGQPVFETYSDERHLTRDEFDADPHTELCIGFDAGTVSGGRPAAVFFQVFAGPRVDVIDEVYDGRLGPTRFAEKVLHALEQAHLREAAQNIRAWCDPSAFAGADKEGGEVTWVEKMETALAITIQQPISNELHAFRLPTVEQLLATPVGMDGSSLRISPRCQILRAGFNSGYRYKKREIAGVEKEDDDPEKNEYSHVQDALQHGVTGYFRKTLIMDEGRRRRDQNVPQTPARSPFSLDFKL